jgi:hypothetical protein
MVSLTVDQWRERILASWEKYGTGTPLDPRTVEHLAQEFAKPLMPEPAPMSRAWPWRGYGITSSWYTLATMHRSIFMPAHTSDDKRAWWDGSCLVTALVKEGPKSIVLYRGKP